MSEKNYTPGVEESVMTDINERFVGDVIDNEKMAKLNIMRDLCKQLSEADKDIRCPFDAFNNRQRHAAVVIEVKSPYWAMDSKVSSLIGEILLQADDVAIAIVENTKTIRISCGVFDLWSEWHYTK